MKRKAEKEVWENVVRDTADAQQKPWKMIIMMLKEGKVVLTEKMEEMMITVTVVLLQTHAVISVLTRRIVKAVRRKKGVLATLAMK